ncbi:type II toxin-antitoxin system Phd/YefM family antitoxin [Nonomuraea sp. NPDC049649]|uniref:type II toxin-antitoxin system Phd/YefM family antitoxin n=1 Tax=Nonomuraea sp. NPDC049649 TaxID=3155776 RepID=UPI00342DF13E
MKAMSATEASRNFAAVLDQAERGETIVVTRGGKQIAVIGPAPTAPGRKRRSCPEVRARWTPISRLTSRRHVKRPTTKAATARTVITMDSSAAFDDPSGVRVVPRCVNGISLAICGPVW